MPLGTIALGSSPASPDRLAVLRITPSALVATLRHGNRPEVLPGLPADCEVVSHWIDEAGRYALQLRSASFDEVPVGRPVPDHESPTIRRIDHAPASADVSPPRISEPPPPVRGY